MTVSEGVVRVGEVGDFCGRECNVCRKEGCFDNFFVAIGIAPFKGHCGMR